MKILLMILLSYHFSLQFTTALQSKVGFLKNFSQALESKKKSYPANLNIANQANYPNLINSPSSKLIPTNQINNPQSNNQVSNISNSSNYSMIKGVSGLYDLPDADVYFQGWIKYFHYYKSSVNEKTNFFTNKFFYDRQNEHSDTKDEFGFLSIPSENYFFSVLYQNKLNILNSRKTAYKQITDQLFVDLIYSIPDDDFTAGGISDLGKFTEGYCFKVHTKIPVEEYKITAKEPIPNRGADRIWLICLDNVDQKDKLMKLIIQLRIKKQHEIGLYLTKDTMNSYKETLEDYTNRNFGSKLKNINNLKYPTANVSDSSDGYWVLLQDWSSCSKKCGGGIQYQQLVCVPPKGNGKQCLGPSERTRPCNSQPCPDFEKAQYFMKEIPNETVNKPIIKQLPISSKPLRYDKCHIKEADALISNMDTTILPNKPTKNKLPIRLIMNEKAIAAYTDDSLSNEVASLLLQETTFFINQGKTSCFEISNKTQRFEVCDIGNSNPISHMNFVDDWKNDFDIFKNHCNAKKSPVELDSKDEKELNDELVNKIEQAKVEVLSERAKKVQLKTQAGLDNDLDKIQEMGMLAIRKEIKFSELITDEEKQKEKNEIDELANKIKEERRKQDMLLKSIKEKEYESELNLNKSRREKELDEMKSMLREQILANRKKMKEKISEMRKRNERTKEKLKNELMEVKNKIAEQLSDINKEGNMDSCFKPSSAPADITRVQAYCSMNFLDSDPEKYAECLKNDEFCYVCCEREFGEIVIKKREECYDKCDKDPKKDGVWQWKETLK